MVYGLQLRTGTLMKRIFYIIMFSLIFLLASRLLKFHFLEAMPIVLLGGCLGWVVAEFKRETKKQDKTS